MVKKCDSAREVMKTDKHTQAHTNEATKLLYNIMQQKNSARTHQGKNSLTVYGVVNIKQTLSSHKQLTP